LIGTSAKAVTGLGQMVAGAVTHPVLHFNYIPGRMKGRGKARHFEPNPHYPTGVDISFPAWFSLFLALGTLATAAGGLGKIFDRLGLTKEEKSALEQVEELVESVSSGEFFEPVKEVGFVYVADQHGWTEQEWNSLTEEEKKYVADRNMSRDEYYAEQEEGSGEGTGT
jgi:hypothetical protein